MCGDAGTPFSISYGEESGAKDIFRAEFRMTPLTQKFLSVPSLLSSVEILVVAGRVEGMEDLGRESMVLQEVLAHLKMLSGRRRCTPSVLVIPYATHSMEQACMLKLSRICLTFPAPHWGFRALPGVHQRRPPPGRPGWIRNPEN